MDPAKDATNAKLLVHPRGDMPITAQARRMMEPIQPAASEAPEPRIRFAEPLPTTHLPMHPVPLNGFIPEAPSVDELQLVQRMFFLSGDEVPRVIVFCGVEARDGVEVVCARTAEVLSCLMNETVCLMDANFHEPTLHRRYQIDASLRFRGADADPKAAGRGSNLSVLPAAALRDSRPGFAPAQVRDRLETLRRQFGFLLICAPPLSTAAEGFLLGQAADGVVLTVMARSTQRAAALKVRRNLELYNVRLLGVVMNERVRARARHKNAA